MSEQSRELGETDCWGETATATQSDACLVQPIGEDEVTLGNPEKPRWSIGIGKKDGWDERTRGVTLNRGNQKPGWKLELEALTDQGGLTEAPLREDYLKRHITQLVMETLENLNIRRAPGQQPKSTERAAVMDDARGGTPLLEPTYRADGAAAAGEDPANPPPQAARTPAPIPNQPRAPQLERETPPPPYVTAEEAEIDMARNQYRVGRAWKKSSPQWKQEPHKPQTAFSRRSSACFKCGKEGHQAAECRSQTPAWNHPPGEGPEKPGWCGKETALRSRQTTEVPSPPLFGEETLVSEQEESHSFGSDPDDEPLVIIIHWCKDIKDNTLIALMSKKVKEGVCGQCSGKTTCALGAPRGPLISQLFGSLH
ncbi:uncharacterized protein LOC132712497 [Pantherophis guttatus]|uniref:Uncharacterized protein LOC132712497 n=1 Tax=Pantherophis guttatus TaxID=94885 RepID=A0ABM3ZP06_PANGU|nr:uncharacterized protein LOC132712497 [Pantherophis guttatus]